MPGTVLACDLYELTMAVSYLAQGMDGEAVFSLFVRDLPPDRGYLVVGGVDDAVDATCSLRSTVGDLGTSATSASAATPSTGSTGSGSPARSGPSPEGRVVTAGEPILEVTAPIAETVAPRRRAGLAPR
jgi:nicotinate phosphoribosyltransferase